MIIDEVDADARRTLEENRFDGATFERLRAGLADGTLLAAGNLLAGIVEPPLPSDLTALPGPGDPGYAAAVEVGTEALRQGTVAMIVLAGGMATRFGGGVKAVTEAVDGRSFLDVKLGETRRLGDALGAAIPTALMTSFATDLAVRAHVSDRGLGHPLVFRQTAAPRFLPDGSLFMDANGSASLYGPGHGDLPGALRDSGTLDALVRRGVRSVIVSNVDNLGARVDPAVVGMHILAGTPLTVEVVEKRADTGGAPARVDDRPQLVESMRFPPDFDQGTIPVFNTNTALVAVEALAEPIDLTWLVVAKDVDGRAVVQFERVYHELSAHMETTFLVVPRDGTESRFVPVKEPADLVAAQAQLRAMLAAPLTVGPAGD